MGRDLLDSKFTFTTPDGEECEGEIPQQRLYPGPELVLEELVALDERVVTRPRGNYKFDFAATVSLEELKNHECICAPDNLWDFCVNKRRAFFRTIVADIHAFRYFDDCMNRNKTVGIPFLPPGIMNNIYSFLDPDTHDWCSWLEVHDKHAGVFYDPDAQCGVTYQNFLAVDIDFSEELFKECEDISDYMYPDCMRESEVMIRIEGYVVHD